MRIFNVGSLLNFLNQQFRQIRFACVQKLLFEVGRSVNGSESGQLLTRLLINLFKWLSLLKIEDDKGVTFKGQYLG